MILFTSVTNHSFRKAGFAYLGLTVFSIVFTFVYEHFSYGESSPYMRLMFLAPLAGMVLCFLSLWQMTWLTNRLSLLLFNSTLGIIASGCLIKGIIEISGRSTSMEQPYWYAAIVFLAMSLLAGLTQTKKTSHNVNQPSRLARHSKA
ncbi:hypothetical protein [Streptococcus moroccensis]|uniref:Uncharacterized protein n=1 Tax=Streptococcus moroccensis TaxID=1451356 RepID=A0ABT9YNQ6_9STRE|nr:hypothetical protein [Streptococcus moroccensis]MDQ0221621.1 hypothetical protein [Streptococcus moroccensis]